MLTSEKLERLSYKYGKTIDDKMILLLHKNNGAMLFVDFCKEMKMTSSLINLHIRKSVYVEKKSNLVVLRRKGKEDKHYWKIPEMAGSIHDFVYSIIKNKPDMKFTDSIEPVVEFCKAKGFSYKGYLNNPNIFSTYKKEVRKRLKAENV